jgi:hypothetical protein
MPPSGLPMALSGRGIPRPGSIRQAFFGEGQTFVTCQPAGARPSQNRHVSSTWSSDEA